MASARARMRARLPWARASATSNSRFLPRPSPCLKTPHDPRDAVDRAGTGKRRRNDAAALSRTRARIFAKARAGMMSARISRRCWSIFEGERRSRFWISVADRGAISRLSPSAVMPPSGWKAARASRRWRAPKALKCGSRISWRWSFPKIALTASSPMRPCFIFLPKNCPASWGAARQPETKRRAVQLKPAWPK